MESLFGQVGGNVKCAKSIRIQNISYRLVLDLKYSDSSKMLRVAMNVCLSLEYCLKFCNK